MAPAEDFLFIDPVLQRIFFDPRRFAPKSPAVAGRVSNLWFAISEAKIKFLKTKDPEYAERLQMVMRNRWFDIRRLCDGYFVEMPAGYADGCEHVRAFEHDNRAREFAIDEKQRQALWYRYGRRTTRGVWRRL
jgi:hypothetical protein